MSWFKDDDLGVMVAKLDPLEISEHQINDSHIDSIHHKMNELNLEKRQAELDCLNWWNKIRRKYNLTDKKLHYVDGEIYAPENSEMNIFKDMGDY